jgi:hypothetical protein
MKKLINGLVCSGLLLGSALSLPAFAQSTTPIATQPKRIIVQPKPRPVVVGCNCNLGGTGGVSPC